MTNVSDVIEFNRKICFLLLQQLRRRERDYADFMARKHFLPTVLRALYKRHWMLLQMCGISDICRGERTKVFDKLYKQWQTDKERMFA